MATAHIYAETRAVSGRSKGTGAEPGRSEEVYNFVITIDYFRLTLGFRPANERRRYKVTPSLIGWVQT